MKANVGGIDRILRIVVGSALVIWAIMGGSPWAWLGLVAIATGLFKFCPLYPLIGFNSCPLKK